MHEPEGPFSSHDDQAACKGASCSVSPTPSSISLFLIFFPDEFLSWVLFVFPSKEAEVSIDPSGPPATRITNKLAQSPCSPGASEAPP